MADVLYNKENTSVVIGELSGITETQVVGSIVSKTLIESKGMSSESIKNLEVSAGEVSSLIKEISSTTSAFLNSLASTWEEFEQIYIANGINKGDKMKRDFTEATKTEFINLVQEANESEWLKKKNPLDNVDDLLTFDVQFHGIHWKLITGK